MKTRLGIIGCGQLSQMLGEAANRQGASVAFLCLDEIPVVQGLGPIFEASDLEVFLKACDVVTVERESIDDVILQRVRDTVGLAPRYEALVVLRERDTQKAMLDALEIPTSPWFCSANREALLESMAAAPEGSLRCKRTLGGYDGGGQWRVTSAEDSGKIPDDGFPVIAEAEIAIERELAIVVARDNGGVIMTYPMTENVMRDGILIGSLVPANVTDAMTDEATRHAHSLVNAMDYVGVLAIEFFVTEGRLIVNEIAPRVHNTGHWTIGAVGADQFTQHVVCTLGGTVREVSFSGAAAMVNLLDDKFPTTLPEAGVRSLIQTYGKGLRKGRKVGHVTLLGSNTNVVREAAQNLIDELHGAR